MRTFLEVKFNDYGYTKRCMWAETGLHVVYTERTLFLMVTVAHKDSQGSQYAHLQNPSYPLCVSAMMVG